MNFPMKTIKAQNRRRSKDEPEYEILDTGIFKNNEYFDVTHYLRQTRFARYFY